MSAKRYLNQLKKKYLACRAEQVWVGQGAVTDEGAGRGGESRTGWTRRGGGRVDRRVQLWRRRTLHHNGASQALLGPAYRLVALESLPNNYTVVWVGLGFAYLVKILFHVFEWESLVFS